MKYVAIKQFRVSIENNKSSVVKVGQKIELPKIKADQYMSAGYIEEDKSKK